MQPDCCGAAERIVLAVIQYASWPLAALVIVRIFEDDIRILSKRVNQWGDVKLAPPQEESKAGEALSSIGTNTPPDVPPPAPARPVVPPPAPVAPTNTPRVDPAAPASAAPQAPAAPNDNSSATAASAQFNELMPKHTSPFLEQRAKIIYDQIEKLSAAQKIEVLVKNTAAFRTFAEFEKIYAVIFGGQIKILTHLKQSGLGGETKAGLIEFYTRAAAFSVRPKELTFDRYMLFLKSQNLVAESGERYTITDFGADFLTYLGLSGYSHDKPY